MINTLRLETVMNYLTRDSRQYIQANIKCENTNDPHEPIEIVITSPTNLLLYFQIRITPTLSAEMCSRLLMEQKKPEDIPAYIQGLIQNRPSTRQFNLVADDDTHFKLIVNDIIDSQLFPRLSLPMVKLSSDVVQQYLRDLLTEERQFSKDAKQRIQALESQLHDEQQMHQNEVTQLIKNEQQARQLMEKAQSELQQLNSQYLTEKSQMQSTIDRINHENMLQKTKLDEHAIQIQQQIVQIEQQNRELQEAAIKVKTHQTAAELLQKQLTDRIQSLESLRKQNDQLNDEKVQNIAQLSQQASKIRQQDGLIQSLESQLQKTTTEMQKRIDNLQAQAQQDQNTLLALTREARDLTYQSEQAKSQCLQLQKTLQETQDKLQETVGKLETQVTANENLAKINAEISAQLKQQQTTKDELERMKNEYTTELENVKAELRTLTREANEYKQRAEHAERKNGIDIMNYLQGDRLPLDQRRENQEQMERILREARMAGVKHNSTSDHGGLSSIPISTNYDHEQPRSISVIEQSGYRPVAKQKPPRQERTQTDGSLYATQTDGSILSGYSKFFKQSTVQPRDDPMRRSPSQQLKQPSVQNNSTNNIPFLDLGKYLQDGPQLPTMSSSKRVGKSQDTDQPIIPGDIQKDIQTLVQSLIPGPEDIITSSTSTNVIQHASNSTSGISIKSTGSIENAVQLSQRSPKKQSPNDALMDQYLNMLNEDIE